MLATQDKAGPVEITGKDFEKKIKAELDSLDGMDFALATNGVQASQRWDPTNQQRIVSTISSMPDMTGTLSTGKRFDFDAKVTGEVSFPMAQYANKGKRRRQLTHGYRYSAMRSIQGFMIHFTLRPAGKRSALRPQETWFLPIHKDMAFWRLFEKGQYLRLKREEISDWAMPVKWHGFSSRSPVGRPNLREMILQAQNYLEAYWNV